MAHIKTGLEPGLLTRQAAVFRALSSPARLAIVRHLSAGPRSVGELVGMLAGLRCPCSSERTNISKHLAVLRDSGIVSSSGDAQRRIYRLETPCLIEAIDCVTEGRCAPLCSDEHEKGEGRKG
jgi:DNA-binding transcriptional ArsR family regulator